MLLTRQQLAAHLFASTDAARGNQYLRVDPPVAGVSTVWATDGHTLARCKALAPPADEFPLIPTIPPTAVSPTASVLLPVQTAKLVEAALRKQRKATTRLPILSYAILKQDGDTLYLAVTDLENPQTWQVRLPDAAFPKVEDVLPGGLYGGKGTEAGPFGISGAYLSRIGSYRGQFDDYQPGVRVTSQGPLAPVVFEWGDTISNHDVLCLVMPMRLPELANKPTLAKPEPAEGEPEQPGEIPNEADNPVYGGVA